MALDGAKIKCAELDGVGLPTWRAMLIPEEPELRKDLEALIAWREKLNKRRDASA